MSNPRVNYVVRASRTAGHRPVQARFYSASTHYGRTCSARSRSRPPQTRSTLSLRQPNAKGKGQAMRCSRRAAHGCVARKRAGVGHRRSLCRAGAPLVRQLGEDG